MADHRNLEETIRENKEGEFKGEEASLRVTTHSVRSRTRPGPETPGAAKARRVKSKRITWMR